MCVYVCVFVYIKQLLQLSNSGDQMECVKNTCLMKRWMNEWMLIIEKRPIITSDELFNFVLWKAEPEVEKDAKA